MKCGRCGAELSDKNKFCPECGFDLKIDQSVAQLYGQEVEVLFFFDPTSSSGLVTGIVNPTLEQYQSHQANGVVQRVVVGAQSGNVESTASVLSFIKKSLEFLAEPYEEERYRHLSLPEMKKEYLRLFERVLKVKAQRQDTLKPGDKSTPTPPKK